MYTMFVYTQYSFIFIIWIFICVYITCIMVPLVESEVVTDSALDALRELNREYVCVYNVCV